MALTSTCVQLSKNNKGAFVEVLPRSSKLILFVPLTYIKREHSSVLWIRSFRDQFVNRNFLAALVRMQMLPQISNFVLLAGRKNIL